MAEPRFTRREYEALNRIVMFTEVAVKVWTLTDKAAEDAAVARSALDRLAAGSEEKP